MPGWSWTGPEHRPGAASGGRARVQVGIMIPQGWKGEYDGWDAAAAWQRTVDLTLAGERLGFESEWVFDHFHTVPDPTDEITFESFSMLAAMAMLTSRVRLGHMVVCASFRNPALTAKLSSTLDVISNGRFELGIGAGWKEDEWLAYGFGFPPIGERMDVLGEHLEVITRMLGPGRATFEGRYVQVREAVNEPKGIQGHIPIIIGGNGPVRTAGYAIQYGDELNFVYRSPEQCAGRIATVRARCSAEGRDPATLRFSLYIGDEEVQEPGAPRVDLLRRCVAAGLDRLVAFPSRWDVSVAGLERFADECREAGLIIRG